ncbi:MAG: hypothetical protein EOO16_01365 [Chitinophagaceae bacterium]|nr:MAG: hypothetical protein EOO16_01365 [Chitinophagaceae bacterium]
MVLIFAFLLPGAYASAQKTGANEARKILCANKWLLRRYEKDGQMFTVPEGARGKKMAFLENGSCFSWMPNEKEGDAKLIAWSINDSRLSIGPNIEDPKYTWELSDLLGYQLRLTDPDEADGPVYVWESAGKMDPGAPSNHSIVINTSGYTGTPQRAAPIIYRLNKRLREAAGNILMYNSGRTRIMVEDASITAQGMGVRMMFKLSAEGKELTTWITEFRPEDISSLKESPSSVESPVGQIRMKLTGPAAYRSSNAKTEGLEEFYTDEFSLYFLKVDPTAYKEIAGEFEQLKQVFIKDRDDRLERLASFMSLEKKFWVSVPGASRTYTLGNAFAYGGSIHLLYYLSTISTSGDSKEFYITELPLNEVASVSLNTSKSRPNTFILRAGKKGFITYKRDSEGRFLRAAAVPEIPLFVDVTNTARRDRMTELLKTHISELGGPRRPQVSIE